MNVSKFLSTYLNAAELTSPKVATIERIAQEELRCDGRVELRLVLYARKATKAIVLNKVNLRQLTEWFGPDTDVWVGQRICVYNDTSVLYQGRRGGIRFRLPSDVVAPAQHVPAAVAAPAPVQQASPSQEQPVAQGSLLDGEATPF